MKLQQVATLGLALLLLCGRSAASEDVGSADVEVAAGTVLAEANRSHYWWNDITGESQWEQPKYEYTDTESEKVYYLHPETKETSWEKFDELMWEEVRAEDGSGTYYYNPATKTSQWEKPIILAWRQVAVGAEGPQGEAEKVQAGAEEEQAEGDEELSVYADEQSAPAPAPLEDAAEKDEL
ncbi:hypothetical protein ABPG77_011280 [Micractinium sp. CCAP 211/92]